MNKQRIGATALGLLLAAGLSAAPMGNELIEDREGHRLTPATRPPTARLIRQLRLPDGFRVDTFAQGLGAPRMMAVGADGTVYVTRRGPGDVVALQDQDGDGKADYRKAVVRNLPGVHGIALRGGKMYLAAVRTVYVVEGAGTSFARPRRLLGGLPPGGRHPNRTLGFGPDGMLYITVGSTCNACLERSPESAAVLRVRPDGSGRTIFARGLRNTVGFGWHPRTKEMWGMDHGTDWLGDDFPPEELNRLAAGNDYGWPLVYADRRIINLEDYPRPLSQIKEYAARTTPPVLQYRAHSAPLQMAFYTGGQFPAEYKNDAFVAMRGSWNREPPSGYEVVRIRFDAAGKPSAIEPFLTGFLLRQGDGGYAHFARLAGLAVDKHGALLVGDDTGGVIYRVSYRAPVRPAPGAVSNQKRP